MEDNPYAGLDTSLLKMKRTRSDAQETEAQKNVLTPKQQNVKTLKYDRKTIYLRLDQVTSLKRLEAERLDGGEKIDLSGLVREAVDLLLKQTPKR